MCQVAWLGIVSFESSTEFDAFAMVITNHRGYLLNPIAPVSIASM